MCDQRERLMDYLYEEAAPADRRVVEAHLESCGDCREEIRAFRRVREDLLAWEVPVAESVWTPFAPQPVMPWHRQIPAWAMAAAAGLMILFGSAGGFAAATLFSDAPAASTAQVLVAPPEQVARVEPAAVLPAPMPMPTGLTDDEIVRLVRRETARLAAGTSLETSQAEQLVAAAAGEQWERLKEYLTVVERERAFERKTTEQTLGSLRMQVQTLEAVVANLVSQQGRGQ
jgi:anti-sigma factor RsiW